MSNSRYVSTSIMNVKITEPMASNAESLKTNLQPFLLKKFNTYLLKVVHSSI